MANTLTKINVEDGNGDYSFRDATSVHSIEGTSTGLLYSLYDGTQYDVEITPISPLVMTISDDTWIIVATGQSVDVFVDDEVTTLTINILS